MYRLLLIIIALAVSASASQKIYLIHGFASNQLSMVRLEHELTKNGFTVKNYGYNSLYTDLDTLGKKLYLEISQLPEDSVSFVTHSMGALVVRSMYQYLDTTKHFPRINRLVMLAPPNRGAEIADFFSANAVINTLMGPNLEKMRTDTNSYANRLPVPWCGETGVIIGVKRKGLWFNRSVRENTDGYLTPMRTELGIEKQVAIVNESHTLVTLKQEVIDLTIRFLREGTFTNAGTLKTKKAFD